MSSPSNDPVKSGDVWIGKKIPLFKSDGTRPSPVSPSDSNQLVIGVNALTNAEIRRGPIDRVYISAGKTIYQIAGNAASGGGGSVLMRFKSMQDFYLVCRTWDGTTEGGTDVLVAKSFKLRPVSVETLRGVLVNYSSYDYSLDGQTRTATAWLGLPETQYITPPFLVNDLIYAELATTLVNDPDTGLPLIYMDGNKDGRAWASY